MKCLTKQEADTYLNHIGKRIGSWNQITDLAVEEYERHKWLSRQAPKDAHELYCFSQHVAGWLSKGDWKILQIDNSTSLDAIQGNFVGRLLFGSENLLNLNLVDNSSFLFEFGHNKNENKNTEVLISNLIYAFLLFEGHVQVASSGNSEGQCLSIQDGFVYFISRDENQTSTEILLGVLERNSLVSPQWVLEIIADDQEERIAGISMGCTPAQTGKPGKPGSDKGPVSQ